MGRRRLSLILDSHALFWWVTDSPMLSDIARAAIAEEEGQCFVSSVSLFELSNKLRLGKLDAARELVERIDHEMIVNDLTALPVTIAHAKLAGSLASPHRDPFDRLLAAQSILEDVPVITVDAAIRDLGAKVVW